MQGKALFLRHGLQSCPGGNVSNDAHSLTAAGQTSAARRLISFGADPIMQYVLLPTPVAIPFFSSFLLSSLALSDEQVNGP